MFGAILQQETLSRSRPYHKTRFSVFARRLLIPHTIAALYTKAAMRPSDRGQNGVICTRYVSKPLQPHCSRFDEGEVAERYYKPSAQSTPKINPRKAALSVIMVNEATQDSRPHLFPARRFEAPVSTRFVQRPAAAALSPINSVRKSTGWCCWKNALGALVQNRSSKLQPHASLSSVFGGVVV